MDERELEFILKEGEGLKIEFKESFEPKSLAKEMVAFANSCGGRIFIGITDKGEVKGVLFDNKLKSQIQDVARNCDPSLKVSLATFHLVLIIEIEEGIDKPYKCSEGFYIREGSCSQKLSRDEIVRLVVDLGKVRFDAQANSDFSFPQDFDKNKFRRFLERANLTPTDSMKVILSNLSLGRSIRGTFRLNNAGILSFAKDVSHFFRQNFLTCVVYKGKERLHILDRKYFNDDLLTNYENGLKFLQQSLKLRYVIEGAGPRKELLELPEEALREALLNALVHRDYFEEGFGVFVELFDDRVEITNKGKLLFDRKKLGTISVSRNPIIFDIFYRLRLMEKVGSGINRIKELMKKEGLKVTFKADDFFRVIFARAKPADVPVNVPVNVPVHQRRQGILSLLEEKGNLRFPELKERFGFVSEKTLKRDIAYLQKHKLIAFYGAAKTGHYRALKSGA